MTDCTVTMRARRLSRREGRATTKTTTTATAGARKDLAGGKRRNENRRTDTHTRSCRTDGHWINKGQ
ncbi:hypothetical protein ALC57_11310 [Trachymyrmex cornetzi]|uniref:Uncharacterized protein n=1 Tax=Trachymyrmex cornetzi TaxID=471704 RepID=A0A195DU57_9HYME|nr:hypothetical protein ALC57_11310 [Trachymyrmex cornetzi]